MSPKYLSQTNASPGPGLNGSRTYSHEKGREPKKTHQIPLMKNEGKYNMSLLRSRCLPTQHWSLGNAHESASLMKINLSVLVTISSSIHYH